MAPPQAARRLLMKAWLLERWLLDCIKLIPAATLAKLIIIMTVPMWQATKEW